MRAGHGINQLPCDANFPRRLAHRPLKDIAHAKLASDLLDIDGSALESETRIASDHEQRFKPRKRYGDLLNHSVRKILLLGISNGNTAIEGLSGSASAGVDDSKRLSGTDSVPEGRFVSCTAPTKRKPLRGSVLIRRCSSPESPITLRAAFRRVVNAASDTIRPFHIALTRSSLLTTRSLLRIK